MTDRIGALELQINALNAELQALKVGKPAPVPAVRDEGARVVPLLTERTDGLPSLKEMTRLYEIVKHLAPWPLDVRYDADRPLRGFISCFRWLANKNRMPQPNPKFALSFWADDCKNWLRDRSSMVSDISTTTLVLAVYAAGDICYTPANSALGHTWEIGVSEHAGRPADPTAWRRVLTGGAAAIRPPSSPARRMAAPSPVRIYGG
jgi:hypothetical protein